MRLETFLQQLDLHTQTLSDIFARSPETQRRKAPQGKWSMHDQLAHLARYQLVFKERIARILSEDTPAFPRYAAETDPGFPGWLARTDEELLQLFRSERKTLLAMLSALGQAQLSRPALHPAYGRMELIAWIEFFTLHEGHHLYSIFQLSRG